MPNANLTAEFVRDLPFVGSGQAFYRDTKLTGFAVKVGKTAKTYIVERRVRGRVRRVTLGPTNSMTVKDARKLAQKTATKMLDGTDPNHVKAEERAKSITLGEAVDLFLGSRKLKPSTAKHYQQCMGWYLSDWQSRQLKEISPAAVVQRFDKITAKSGGSTANLVFRYFRSIYNHALAATATADDLPTLPKNPATRLSSLKRWHKAERRTTYLTDEHFALFFRGLAESGSPVFADFMELLIRTGLRRTEAASLSWTDVNMTAKTFHIRAEISKNGKDLTLPMSTQVEALFHRRREAAPEAERVFGQAKRYDPRKSLLRLRERLPVDISFHDLRRTFAILAERCEVPFSLLKQMLNHSTSGDVTLTHYLVGDDPETLRKYAQRISDELDRLSRIDQLTAQALPT